MAASIAVEVETGTITSVRIRHNGYYAGDFRRTGVAPTSSSPRTASSPLRAYAGATFATVR